MKKVVAIAVVLGFVFTASAQTPSSPEVKKLEQTVEKQEATIRTLQKQVETLRNQSIQTTYGKRMEIDRRSKQPVYR